jgi:uncharacterized protein
MSRAGVAAVTAALLLTTACTAGGGRASEPAARSPRPPLPSITGHPSVGPSDRASGEPSRTGTATTRTAKDRVDPAVLNARLIDAAWENDLPRVRRLVGHGADVNAEDATEQSAYLIATSEGHLELLELALRHGADVDAKDSFNGTGLIRAADRGHADIAGRLVQAGVEVDHVNELGWTALHEAIILGDGSRRYVDTVRVLLAAGTDLRVPSERDGITPLQHAESRGHGAIAALLRAGLRQRAIRRPEADRRLLSASARGDADAAALALRAGARIETRDGHRRTPLLLASTHDRRSVARLLVHLGADPDALDDRHDTPWLVTGVTGSVPMLEILLPAHPDLGITNRFGGLSVIPASERGHLAYVRRVVRTGIDVDHVNDLGWTALLEAVVLGDGSRRYQAVVRTLLEAGADPTIPDRDGVTAVQHAERRGHRAVARVLRSHPTAS